MDRVQIQVVVFQKVFKYCWTHVYFNQTSKHQVYHILGIMLNWEEVLADSREDELYFIIFYYDILLLKDSQYLGDQLE